MVTQADVQSILNSLTDDQWEKLPIDDIRDDSLALYVVKNYVRNILLYDLHQAPFTYLNGEQKVTGRLSVPGVGEAAFYGYIDRLDKQCDTLRVIDYKTGKAHIEYRDMEHIFHREENQDKALQTLLYCWLLKQQDPLLLSTNSHIAPHIYPARSMSNIDEVETLIHQKGNTSFVFDATIEKEFLNKLSELLQEIYDPSIPFMPTKKAQRCSSCAFYTLCKG